MRNIFVIFLKELKRVFLDKRMLISLFLPGVLIFVIYSLMGNIMSTSVFSASTQNTTFEIAYTDNYSTNKDKEPLIIQGMKAYVAADEENNNTINATSIPTTSLDDYLEKLKNNEIHLLINFTDNFDDKDITGGEKNNITLRYNGESNASSDVYLIADSLVQTVYNDYTINMEKDAMINPNIGDKDMSMMKIMSFIIPMVTISLLFSTIVSLCPEAIAGEKERGTLASILLTPIRRRDFALGKILALSVLAIASGTTSFLGLILSVPTLLGGTSINIAIAPLEIVLLFFLVVSILLLFIGLGVFISSLANTIKEAASYLSPLMILFMLFGIIPSVIGADQIYFAFIPVLNVCAAINNLLLGSSNLVLFFALTVAANIVYTGILIFFITRAFEKERIVLGQ